MCVRCVAHSRRVPPRRAAIGVCVISKKDLHRPSCPESQSGYNHSYCIYKQDTPMSDLTPRQTQILRLIQRHIGETGMPPTRAEIAHELGFRSANAAEEHLRVLARKGVIALVPGTSRGIK